MLESLPPIAATGAAARPACYWEKVDRGNTGRPITSHRMHQGISMSATTNCEVCARSSGHAAAQQGTPYSTTVI